MNQSMEECGDAVGVGSMDFSVHTNWLDALLNDDDDDGPYSIKYIDLSFSTNKEIIDFVRANYELYNKEKNLHPPPANDLPDPWELARPWFITCKKFGSDEKTRHGYWKEIGTEFTAIPADQLQFLPPPVQRGRRPVYIGFKRMLEFYMKDGTKTDWLMSEFAMIHQSDDGLFFLKEEVVISEVYKQKDKDVVLCPPIADAQNNLRDVANSVLGEHGEGEYNEATNRNNIASHDDDHRQHQGVQRDQAPTTGKRLRSDNDPVITRTSESEVWQQFTKIYIQVHSKEAAGRQKGKDGKKLVYAVCHHCDRVFRASPKNGTSSLRRHAEGCQCKHLNQARERDNVLQPAGPSGSARCADTY